VIAGVLGDHHLRRAGPRVLLGRVVQREAIIGFFAAALGFAGVFTMTTAVLLAGVAVVLLFGLATAGQSLEDLSERRGLDVAAPTSPDVP
jgi:hypothetical protein